MVVAWVRAYRIWSLIQSTGVTGYHLSLVFNGTYLRSTNSKLSSVYRSHWSSSKGGNRSCPIASSDCSVSFSIAQSMMHFDQWIGLQLWTRLTISSSGQTLFYCSALFYLTVNRYTVTVQKRQFLVSRSSWSPSHHRMQPISYRRIFCLGQS